MRQGRRRTPLRHRLLGQTHNPPSSPAWNAAWLEWGLRPDYARPEARGAYAFVAGVTFRKGNANAGADPQHHEWLGARLNQGFEQVTDQWPRLWSYHYPEQLLIASTFEEQADLLAGWVLARFDTLTTHPPSPGSITSGRELGA